MSLHQSTSRIHLVSRSAPTRRVERDALLAARGDANVLIVGERGPVKAALARFIHEQSDRSAQAFAALKCDRLSDELIRSELFGGVDKPGVLTSAFRGTVLLDEIGALGAATQDRLLRHLDITERAIGGARLIAATSVSLKAHAEAGLFHSELYDRLSAVQLVVPPQRERRNDIHELQVSA